MSIHFEQGVGDVKIDPHMNYHGVTSARSTYMYQKKTPEQNKNTVYLSDGGSDAVQFQPTTEDICMGESYLEYDEDIVDQGNGWYPVVHRNVDGEFKSVKYSDSGNQEMVNMDNVHLYNEFMNSLNFSPEDLDFLEGLDCRLMKTNAPLTDVKCKRPDNTTNSIPYLEPQQLEWGNVGTNANGYSYTRHKKVYLKDLIRQSHFGDNKNQMLPAANFLDIVFQGRGVAFRAYSATDPTENNGGQSRVLVEKTIGGQPPHAIRLSNIVLWLAVETNQNNIIQLKHQIADETKKGGSFAVPITFAKVYTFPVNAGATNWTFEQALKIRENGKKIKAIIYGAVRTYDIQNPHLYYDRNNGTTGLKIKEYQTYLDSAKLQNNRMRCDGNNTDDWTLNKSSLENTQYRTLAQYRNKKLHIDRFDYPLTNDNPEGNVMTDGLTLDVDKSWSIDVTDRADPSVNLTNVAIVISQKILTVNSTSFAVISAETAKAPVVAAPAV